MPLFAEGSAESSDTGGDPTTISWYYLADKQPDQDAVFAAFNEQVKDLLNVEVDFRPLNGAAFNERMPLIISSGEEFDITFTASWANNFRQNVSRGAFVALDEMLDGPVSGLRDAIPGFLWQSAKVDNEIYAVPNYQQMYKWWAILMPRRIAEEYGIDMTYISDLRQLEPYLELIRDNEPQLFPIHNPYQEYTERITPSFAVIRKAAIGSDDAFTVHPQHDTREHQAMLELRRDWMEAGFFRPDIATVENTNADRNNLRYAMWMDQVGPDFKVNAERRYGEEIIGIPVLPPYIESAAGIETMNAISRTSRNPEMALRFLEVMQTDKELYNMLSYGIEGEHYEFIEENTIRLVEDSGYQPNRTWMFGNTFNRYLTEGEDPEVLEQIREVNATALRSPLRGFNFDAAPVRTQIQQVQAVVKEFGGISWVESDSEYDSLFDEYRTKLKQAGQDEIVEEVQRQVDAWLEGVDASEVEDRTIGDVVTTMQEEFVDFYR